MRMVNFTSHILEKCIFPIIGNIGAYQGDLVFFPKYVRQNHGYAGAFIVVGMNHRFAYGHPFKSKASKDINPILEQFIVDAKQDGKEITILATDNGSEFISKSAQKIFEQNGIHNYTHEPGNHKALGKIDAFSRTIKRRIAKYMTEHDTVQWVDVFPYLIYNYNNTIHSAIKMRPSDVTLKDENSILNKSIQKSEKIKNRFKHINVGDVVRIPLKKDLFEKEGQTYSSELYTVDSIRNSKVAVRNPQGNLLRNKYNIQEIQLAGSHQVSKPLETIKKAKKENKIERLIKREGLEPNYSDEPRQSRRTRFTGSYKV
jgi:hypothetical protein